MHWLYIFCFVLIDLINDYKNIYFRNNVYVGFVGWFLWELILLKDYFLVWKKCYRGVFVFVCMLFERDYKFNCFFSMERGYRGVFVFIYMHFKHDYKFNCFFSMKRGYRSVFVFICMLFKHDYKFNCFLVWKEVVGVFWDG